MNCPNCKKPIPDGFTECPWCGEPYAALRSTAPAAPSPAPASLALSPSPSEPPQSSLLQTVAWLLLPLSLVVVVFAAYQATEKKFGSVSLENSAYFLGACAGPYIVSALIALIYYFARKRKVPRATQLLIAFCGASFFAIISLLNTSAATRRAPVAADFAPTLRATSPPALASTPTPMSAPVPHRDATIWDPVIISLYADLKSHNEAYVAAVSQLDVTAQPLYRPDSFRDAATIQKILAQLQDRLAVADQFSSLDPVLAKMPSYLSAINASESDKRAFLASFMPAVQRSVAQRNAASAYEHDWLRSTIALYQFMQANQSAYAISPDGTKGTFYRPDVSKQFESKMQKSQMTKQQFLQANRAYLVGQSAARAQMGLPD